MVMDKDDINSLFGKSFSEHLSNEKSGNLRIPNNTTDNKNFIT